MKFATALAFTVSCVSATRVNWQDLHNHEWFSSPYKSSVWKTGADEVPRGDVVQITAAAGKCPVMDKAYFAAVYGTSTAGTVGTTDQAQFIKPTDGYLAPNAYNVTAGYTDAGFGKFPPLGHGIYCPTVDSSFFYNEVTDSYIWHNWANNQWAMGKPSVEWWFTVDASSPRVKAPCPDTDLPSCAVGANADLDDNQCPTCIVTNGRGPDGGECTEAKIAECDNPIAKDGVAKEALPECKDGKRPAREVVSCCLTCFIPEVCVATEEMKGCNNVLYNDLPECVDVAAQGNSWDTKNCCYSCKRPAPPTPATTAETCTKAMIDSCLANTPVCVDTEEPKHGDVTGQCCPSCKRAERQQYCLPEDVAKCLVAQPLCKGSNTPQLVDGECCESCKKADPCGADAKPCGANQKCAVINESSTGLISGCVDFLKQGVTLTIPDATRLSDISSLSDLSIRAAVTEMVNRYCDVPTADRKTDCDRFKITATSALSVENAATSGNTVTMNVEAASASADFLKAALSDAATDEGVSGSFSDTLFPDQIAAASMTTASAFTLLLGVAVAVL